MSKNKKLVVSLFCGIGGLDLGFESAGFEIAVAIDNNHKVLELYRLNFPDTKVLCRDIGEISATEIRESIQKKYPNWDGEIAAVIGGTPCQGFSVAGKQNLDDSRSQLVLKFINLVVELNPLMFVMENVPAMAAATPFGSIAQKKFAGITGNALAKLTEGIALIEEHYILSKWLLTASDFSVPQKRQRAIWVGSKFGEVAAPVGSEKEFKVGDAIPKVSVFDAIADLTHIPINTQTDTWELNQKGEYAQYLDKIFPGASKPSSRISGCLATAHTAATQQKYGDTIPGEKEPTTWAKRLSADGFSPTLRAGSGNRTAARPIHYEHARVITVRETARLHSFPDWFDFGTSKLAAHKAIGNSVPPLLGYAIALQVWTHLEEQQTLADTSCFVLTHVPDLRAFKASVDLSIFCSIGQQLGILNYLAFGLVDREISKVGNERRRASGLPKTSPPLKSCIKNHCNLRFSDKINRNYCPDIFLMTDSYAFKFEDSEASVALKNRQFSSVDSYEARLSLFNLSILADYDQLVCLPELANIDKHWYQIETAKKVIKQFGGRAMLSDEVGLGKTIEAAMICKEYLQRCSDRRFSRTSSRNVSDGNWGRRT